MGAWSANSQTDQQTASETSSHGTREKKFKTVWRQLRIPYIVSVYSQIKQM